MFMITPCMFMVGVGLRLMDAAQSRQGKRQALMPSTATRTIKRLHGLRLMVGCQAQPHASLTCKSITRTAKRLLVYGPRQTVRAM